MPRRGRRRSRGAMSVEYALMLVLVSGMLLTGLGAVVKINLDHFLCEFKAALSGSSCDDTDNTDPPTSPGPGPTDPPPVAAPSPAEPTPTCDPTTTSDPSASPPDPSATDCSESPSPAGVPTSATN